MITQDMKSLLFTYLLLFSFNFALFSVIRLYYQFPNLLAYLVSFTISMSSQIFFFSFKSDNTRYIDPFWIFNGIFIIVNSFSFIDSYSLFVVITNLNEKVILFSIISLLTMYSLRHLFLYCRTFISLSPEHKDFRYLEFEVSFDKYKGLYWIFNYLFLHVYPVVMEAFLMYPIAEIIELFSEFKGTDHHKRSFGFVYLGYFVSMMGLFVETIADEQLMFFIASKHDISNINKNQNPINGEVKDHVVMSRGLWTKIRHPNYLGELIFYFGFLMMNIGVTTKVNVYLLLPYLAFICMFVFYSIPVMENRLLTKYRAEYAGYQRRSYKLFPYVY